MEGKNEGKLRKVVGMGEKCAYSKGGWERDSESESGRDTEK